MIKTFLTKLVTVKAATVLAVGAAGGVAVAAGTGAIPNPLSTTPAVAPSDGHGDGSAGTPSHPGRPSAMPSSALVGLCRAYTAGAGSDHGAARKSPAFTALASAAGGADQVDGFCKALLASPASRPAGADPSTHATATPSHAADGHPTGVPSGHPSHLPSQPGH